MENFSITSNLFIHLLNYETEEESLTYFIYEYCEESEIEFYAQNDIESFVPIANFAFFDGDKECKFHPELLNFIEAKSRIDKEEIIKTIKSKFVWLYDENNRYKLSIFNTTTLESNLNEYKINKALFRNQAIERVIINKLENMNILFSECQFAMTQVLTPATNLSKLGFENCVFGHLRYKSQYRNVDKTVEISKCSIEYLYADYPSIKLVNVTLGIFFHNTKESNREIIVEGLEIFYNSRFLKKYYSRNSPYIEIIQIGPKIKNKTAPWLERLSANFGSPNLYLSGRIYLLTSEDEIQLGSISLGSFFWDENRRPWKSYFNYKNWLRANSVLNNLPKGMYRYEAGMLISDESIERKLALEYLTVQKGILSTFQYMRSKKDLISEKDAIDRYSSYFYSRRSLLLRLLYVFHQGYYNILIPFIAFVTSTIFTALFIQLWIENLKLPSLTYVVLPAKFFEEILFSGTNIFFPLDYTSLIKRIIILCFELFSAYSLFCFIVAVKRRFGFPKKLE
ncbi:hypothetical protein AB3N59_19710 [Leptospira sp. WS92.C1]